MQCRSQQLPKEFPKRVSQQAILYFPVVYNITSQKVLVMVGIQHVAIFF